MSRPARVAEVIAACGRARQRGPDWSSPMNVVFTWVEGPQRPRIFLVIEVERVQSLYYRIQSDTPAISFLLYDKVRSRVEAAGGHAAGAWSHPNVQQFAVRIRQVLSFLIGTGRAIPRCRLLQQRSEGRCSCSLRG